MKRLIHDQLRRWKAADRRKPLIIGGGRQVGKTWSVEDFGREGFEATIKVDLEKRADLHSLFAGDLDSRTLLPRLEVAVGRRVVPGATLLFLDEIGYSIPSFLIRYRSARKLIPNSFAAAVLL